MITLSPSGLRKHEVSDDTGWVTNENYNITRLNNLFYGVPGLTRHFASFFDTSISSLSNNNLLVYEDGEWKNIAWASIPGLTTTTV